MHQKELLFHTTKHFEVKKWVRSQTAKKETVTFDKLLKYVKEHEATVRDFNCHKSNRGVAMVTTIDEIRTFKFRKGNGHRAKGGSSKTCGRCDTVSPAKRMPSKGQDIATSVEIKIISVHVVGPGKRTPGTVMNTT